MFFANGISRYYTCYVWLSNISCYAYQHLAICNIRIYKKSRCGSDSNSASRTCYYRGAIFIADRFVRMYRGVFEYRTVRNAQPKPNTEQLTNANYRFFGPILSLSIALIIYTGVFAVYEKRIINLAISGVLYEDKLAVNPDLNFVLSKVQGEFFLELIMIFPWTFLLIHLLIAYLFELTFLSIITRLNYFSRRHAYFMMQLRLKINFLINKIRNRNSTEENNFQSNRSTNTANAAPQEATFQESGENECPSNNTTETDEKTDDFDLDVDVPVRIQDTNDFISPREALAKDTVYKVSRTDSGFKISYL